MYPTSFLLRILFFLWCLLQVFGGLVSAYDAFVEAEEYARYWKAQGPFAEYWYYESAGAYYFVMLFVAAWGALGMAASVWYQKHIFATLLVLSVLFFLWGDDILLFLWRLFVPA